MIKRPERTGSAPRRSLLAVSGSATPATPASTGSRTPWNTSRASSLEPEDRDRMIAEGWCFICQEQGHLARDYLKKKMAQTKQLETVEESEQVKDNV